MTYVNKTTEQKIKAIIMTILYTNKGEKISAKTLTEWINTHDYGITELITTRRIGAILRQRNGGTFIKHIQSDLIYDKERKQYATHYWVE